MSISINKNCLLSNAFPVDNNEALLDHPLQAIKHLIHQVEKNVIGQGNIAKALVIGLLTNGHILLEGLPGTAKTRSVRALADALNASFGRIQFTPDLLPSDVTGTEIYQDHAGNPQLHFQPGPIFHNIVLADEVNRAPAKVQAALLEAMAEGTVTIGDQTHTLPPLFMVLATQNPIEQEGTYSLPEAQMDRFLLKVNVHYPTGEMEKDIIRLVRAEENSLCLAVARGIKEEQATTGLLRSMGVNPDYILKARTELTHVEVSELVEDYIIGLVMATRQPEQYPDTPLSRWIDVGVSPRASIALDKCARANAWLAGRDFVLPDDVREIAAMVMGHRITLSYDAEAEGILSEQVISALLDCVRIG